MFRSIRLRLVLPYLTLILLSMLGLAAYLSHLVRAARVADLQVRLSAEAGLLADEIGPLLASGAQGGA
ncbi:MAG: hypothetical protein ACUVX9_19100, partial [Anaerolineae bacterium]